MDNPERIAAWGSVAVLIIGAIGKFIWGFRKRSEEAAERKNAVEQEVAHNEADYLLKVRTEMVEDMRSEYRTLKKEIKSLQSEYLRCREENVLLQAEIARLKKLPDPSKESD